MFEMKKFICLTIALLFISCNSGSSDKQTNVVTTQSNEKTNPVTPIQACKILTTEDLKLVFPNKDFEIETDRNDPPNIYEALSACTYKEKGKDTLSMFSVDLEIRAMPSNEEALKYFNSKIEMDYDKRGVLVPDLADKVYFYNQSMAYGGPTLEFSKNNAYFKIKILVFNGEAIKLAESQLKELYKIIVKKM